MAKMRTRTCKNNQRRRMMRVNQRKVNGRYRVYYRVVLSNKDD
ncbi:hypothetical protein [Thalassotalea sp. Y01]|nr:hypothetical protein [Thalassotalea sp. Y01]